jgi:hypothetical protein
MTTNTNETKDVEALLDQLETLDEDTITDGMLTEADFSVPGDFANEVMGSELARSLAAHQTLTVALIAAEHSGNKQEEQHRQARAYERNRIAFIQSRYPAAKALAKEILIIQAQEAKQMRGKILKAEA